MQNSDPQKKVLSMLRKAEALFANDLERSASLCFQSIKESKASKRKDLLAASWFISGKCFLVRAELKRSAAYFEQARRYYEKAGDTDAVLEMEQNSISIQLFSDNPKEILIRLHQILDFRLTRPFQISRPQNFVNYFIPRSWKDRLSDKIPSPKEIENAHQIELAELYGTLWRAYMEIRDKKGISYLEKILSIATGLKNDKLKALALNNLGVSYTIFGNNALAMEYLQKSLKVYRRIGHKRGESAAIKNLALVYFRTGHPALGKGLSLKSLRMVTDLKMWEAASRTVVTLAIQERLHGSLTKADAYISEALGYWKGRGKSAVFYFLTLQQLLIEHARNPSRKTFDKLVRLYKAIKGKGLELENDAVQEIARIAQELGLGSESVRWLKIVHKHEIEKIKNEQKNSIASLQTQTELERMAKEREMQALRVENLELDLKAKARETELLAVQLAKKGSVLTDLKDRLTEMRSSKNQYSSETINAVIGLIESVRFKDKEYEHLEERAEVLHHDFLVSLSDTFPLLTATEKRVCVLLKLGLKPVDIASVLFTSVRTVETHCLSIRKKLHLPRKIRLLQYLQRL
ncbi:MAG: transcriptional regulator [Candidatus Kapaibacterium sp.]